MIVLDTSAIIEWVRGTEKGAQLRSICTETTMISSISAFEFLLGIEQLQGFTQIPFGEYEANISARLHKKLLKKGDTLSRMDTLIAGTAIANNCELVTLDKDFKKVPGLKVTVI